jgi:hypothetical protein
MGSLSGALLGIVALFTFGGQALAWLDIAPVLSRDLKLMQAETIKNFDKINDNFKVVQAQIETLTTVADRAEWGTLNAKLQQNGTLEFLERQRYCSLSRELGYTGIPICGI